MIFDTGLVKLFRKSYRNYSMDFEIEENANQKEVRIEYLRALSTENLFKEALGDIYSDRYFQDNRSKFGKHLFIFEVKAGHKTWSLMKNQQDITAFLRTPTANVILDSGINDQLDSYSDLTKDDQASLFEVALRQILESSLKVLELPFFQANREGYGTFSMRKRSGGRYKQSTCCKFGSILQRWKQRSVAIFLKGVAYYNQKGKVRQFLSFSHGFQYQFGKPQTGIQLGLTLYANHRQLSLEAYTVKDFIYFLFTLKSACKESCYLTLNRFNSFAPLRYHSAVKFFIDGKDYFDALFDSFYKASKSILIMGWMISPQFLLQRQNRKVSFEDLVHQAAERGVTVNIILYHEPIFLPNGSQYAKNKLQSHENIRVLCHPCGKLPTLWSHHGKLVIIDEAQAFVGGLDICYGRYDTQKHQLYPPMEQYPGLEHNNLRKNDQWNVKVPEQNSIPTIECRLPWHDIAQSVKGDVVVDLAHHFYQMWSFIRYENKIKPEDSYAPSLFQTDVKSVFSTKVIVEQNTQNNFLQAIENGLGNIRTKGKQLFSSVKTKLSSNPHPRLQSRPSRQSQQDYFHKYLRQIEEEIKQVENNHKGKRNRNSSRSNGCRSQRYSVQDVKNIQQTIQKLHAKEDKMPKTNSFLLCGEKKTDFLSLEIDHDYVTCLEKLKKLKGGQEDKSNIVEVDSDDEPSTINPNDDKCRKEGRDQCQVIRSAGNWSIGCHPSNAEFSIHIAYLQLISQAKHYIYIQNQFFISSLANQELVKNEIAEAIYLRIRKAINSNQRFVVYVVLPLLPGFSGDLENEDCTLLRKTMQWQYDTICRGENSLYHKLLNHTNDPSQYIQFLSLRTHARRTADSQPQTQIIYVHSKLMIIDDEVVLCGSANINDRSLLGYRDSQLAIISKGEDFVQSKMNGSMVIVSQSAQELRIKLWKEHFGLTEGELLDPLAKETWQAIAERAASNTQLYGEIFGCYPSDEMVYRKDIQARRLEGNQDLYDKLSKQIKGNVVEFPLHFLEKEPLSCLVTEKQFYMPTQCLT